MLGREGIDGRCFGDELSHRSFLFLFSGMGWGPNGQELSAVMGLLLVKGSNRWGEDDMGVMVVVVGCQAHGAGSWLRVRFRECVPSRVSM